MRAATPGNSLPSSELEGGASAGGDEGHAVGEAKLRDGGDGIPAADDRLCPGFHERLRYCPRAFRELGDLEDAGRPVPEHGLCGGDLLFEARDGLAADIDGLPALADAGFRRKDAGVPHGRARLDLLRLDAVHGEQEFDALFCREVEDFAGEIELVGFDAARSDADALGFEKGVGHRPADKEGVGLLHEGLDDADLVGHLRAAQDDEEGPFGRRQLLVEIFQLPFEEHAHRGLAHEPRDAGGRCVRAVGCAKRVVDIHVSELREGLGESGVVRLFLVMETEIFEQSDVAGAQAFDDFLGDDPGAFVAEQHRVRDQLMEADAGRAQRVFLHRLALRPAEVRHEDDARAGLAQELDGGNGCADARVIGDDLAALLFLERDVEVHANQDAAPVQLDVANREFAHGRQPQPASISNICTQRLL